MKRKTAKTRAPKGKEAALSLTAAVELEVLEAAEGEGAKRHPFKIKAYTGGTLRLGFFPWPVVIDLNGLTAGRTTVLRDHDLSQVVGQGEASVTTNTVTVVGHVTGDPTDKDDPSYDIVLHAKNDFVWSASVGVSVQTLERVSAGATVKVNGKRFTGPIDVVRTGRLGEVSFVGVGADENASAKIAAEAARNVKGEDMEFAKWLKAKFGLEIDDLDALDDEKREKLEAAYKIECKADQAKIAAAAHPQNTAQTAAPPVGAVQAAAPPASNAVIEAAQTEQKRQEDIGTLVTAHLNRPGVSDEMVTAIEEIRAKAISDKTTTLQGVELGLTRATRAPRTKVGGPADAPQEKVLAAQMLLACGLSDEGLSKDRDFGEQVAEAAYTQKGIGIHQLFASALEAEGVHAPHGGEALFRAAVGHQVKAGFSTVDLPGIIGTVGNKLLQDSFTAQATTHQRIAAQVDHSNFLTHTRYRLNETGGFELVAPDGEIKHGALSEESYTNRLDTRGEIITLTRVAIINDDLNAFAQIPTLLGRKAVIKVESAVYDALMESVNSFYTAAQGNLNTGNALAVAALGVAEAAMLAQVGADGEPILAMPVTLLVPSALKFLGDQLNTSATVNQVPASNTAQGVNNPFAGRFTVESSPYLSLSTKDGNSATTWYMLADPSVLPAFEVAYLQGRRQPTIESSDARFDVLGVQMRVYFDFGVAQVDYRGVNKNTA